MAPRFERHQNLNQKRNTEFHTIHSRLLFLLAWIACVVYTIYMIMTSIVTFINKPTGTKYEVLVNDVQGTKPQSIKFPTISICSHNKVKKR